TLPARRRKNIPSSMKHPLPLLVLILLPVTATAQPPAKTDLALRARAILRKHCGDCHGFGTTQHGEWSVVARSEMDQPGRATRPFLRPGDPKTSQIIELIEAGNMPPGTRPKVPAEERQELSDWITSN